MPQKKLTRTKAIRQKCIDCSDGQKDRMNCVHADCPLHTLRTGKRTGKVSPKKAIAEYCRWCMNKSLEKCNDADCAINAANVRTPHRCTLSGAAAAKVRVNPPSPR